MPCTCSLLESDLAALVAHQACTAQPSSCQAPPCCLYTVALPSPPPPHPHDAGTNNIACATGVACINGVCDPRGLCMAGWQKVATAGGAFVCVNVANDNDFCGE